MLFSVCCFLWGLLREIYGRRLVPIPGPLGVTGAGTARGEAEEGALALQSPALLRGEEANLAVFAVVAPGDMDLSPAHLIQAMG